MLEGISTGSLTVFRVQLSLEDGEGTKIKNKKDVLTDVVSSLLNSVSLEEVVSQHKRPGLHGVEEQSGRVQLLAGGQLPPRRLGSWLQQIIHSLHHSLGQHQKHRGHTEEANTSSSVKDAKVKINANPFSVQITL